MDNSEQNEEQRNGEPISIRRLYELLQSQTQDSARSANDARGLAMVALAQLIGGRNGGSLALLDADEEEDSNGVQNEWEDEDDQMDEDDDDWYPQRSSNRLWFSPHTSPQAAGVELLNSGEFGRVGPKIRAQCEPPNINMNNVIRSRLSTPFPRTSLYKEDLASRLTPNTNGVVQASYGANIYTAQYSADSSFFYTCAQDFRLHIYDTEAPPTPVQPGRNLDHNLRTTMKVNRTIQGSHGRWTITDANLSPDNQRIVYSSITPTAYMCSTTEENPVQIPIRFADRAERYSDWDDYGNGQYVLYSCRFSADGNEIIAGGRGHIFVYDLLANRRSVKIQAHSDDVNSCCWADTASGNVLVSASDDSFLKVWDRRSLGASPKPSGVLVGHTEGITYVSAKGDGRYVLSNGKDQSMRLWDLRKMRGSEEISRKSYGVRGFDYRYASYSKPRYESHPLDCSVMTYRGHQVFRTLIRCHFSPAETTGGQYLYSGSSDGKIHIWSLDGRIVQVLDRSKSLPISVDPTGPEFPTTSRESGLCVRDVSWHSQQPVMMSAAWEGNRHGSTLARHDWKGLNKMGSLEDWNERESLETAERERATRGSTRSRISSSMPGAFFTDVDVDDDDEEDDSDYQP